MHTHPHHTHTGSMYLHYVKSLWPGLLIDYLHLGLLVSNIIELRTSDKAAFLKGALTAILPKINRSP